MSVNSKFKKAGEYLASQFTDEETAEAIFRVLDRPIAFHKIFVDMTGSIYAALFLSQAIYWSQRCGEDGWFYKTMDEWHQETGMGKKGIMRARLVLMRLGLIQVKREGIPCRLFYHVDAKRLALLAVGKNGNGTKETDLSDQDLDDVVGGGTKEPDLMGSTEPNKIVTQGYISRLPGGTTTIEETTSETKYRDAGSAVGALELTFEAKASPVPANAGIRTTDNGTPNTPPNGAAPPRKKLPRKAKVWSDDAKAVLAHLNEAAGRKFMEVDANLRLIERCMSVEGASVKELNKMVDRMVAMWKGDFKMDEYLRPATLFGPENFIAYFQDRDRPAIRFNQPQALANASRPQQPWQIRQNIEKAIKAKEDLVLEIGSKCHDLSELKPEPREEYKRLKYVEIPALRKQLAQLPV